jgi:hypothetical protein
MPGELDGFFFFGFVGYRRIRSEMRFACPRSLAARTALARLF